MSRTGITRAVADRLLLSGFGERQGRERQLNRAGSIAYRGQPLAIESSTFLPPTERVYRALTFLHARCDDQLLMPVQSARYRQQPISDFRLELFRNSTDFRKQLEILLTQPVLNSAFGH